MSVTNLMLENVNDLDPTEQFCRIGRDILDSEELTNEVYEIFLAMIPRRRGWHGRAGQSRHEFHVSDLALMYRLGPYVLCTPRVAFTRTVDIVTDGWPGVSVTAEITELQRPHEGKREISVHLIRPIDKFPRKAGTLGHCARRYRMTEFWSVEGEPEIEHEGGTTYFGIRKDGRVVPVLWGRRAYSKAWQHAYGTVWPATNINQWADAKYLWLCETSEDVGIGRRPLRLRLGVSAEHIKSLFYARTLPRTETGRKRPILHWVRAHQRRLAEGIDIDIRPHLRGITEFPLDGLNFRITQPDKEATRLMDIPTVGKAWEMYRAH